MSEKSVSDAPQRSRSSRCLFVAFLMLLVWLPLPLGSDRVWAVSVMAIATFLLLGVWSLGWLRRPYPLPEAAKSSSAAWILFGAWLAYVFLQTIPLPAPLVKLLSPAAYALHELAIEPAGRWQTLSVDGHTTRMEFVKYLSYVAIFFLGLVLTDSRRRLETLVMTLFLVGFAEAIYGLTARYVYPDLLWNPSHRSVSGTYLNRNHLAGLLELTIPCGLALFMTRLKGISFFAPLRGGMRSLIAGVLHRRNLIMLCAIAMFGTLFLTTSRGGTLALLVSLVIVLAVGRRFGGRHAPESRLVPWLVVALAIAVLSFGLGSMVGKIVDQGLENDRFEVWRSALRAAADFRWTGSGYGTFAVAHTPYRGAESRGIAVDHAHNDYLEQLSSGGIIGTLLLGGALVGVFVVIGRGYTQRRDPLMRAMLFASLTGTIALLLHGFVDFNFQIPANAAYFFVLLAIGCVATTLRTGATARRRVRDARS